MSHRASLTSLTDAQRQQLHDLMQAYLTDVVVNLHGHAHAPGIPGVVAWSSHRELIRGLERFIEGQPHDAILLPVPMLDPLTEVPAGTGCVGSFRDVRAPDDPMLPTPPWPPPGIPMGWPPPGTPPWPPLVSFGPFDGTGGRPNLPLPAVASLPALCAVANASQLWTQIGTWHNQVHNAIGGTMAAAAFTQSIRMAAYIFTPWHAYVDHIYWDYQHCPGHGWSFVVPVPGWFGEESQGASLAAGDINGNGRPDLVVFHVDHPVSSNTGHFRIGWDLDTLGNVNSWSSLLGLPDPVGPQTQGAGVELAHVGGGPEIDLIVFWVEQTSGVNHGRYRIGWDLDPLSGQPASWSAVKTVQPDPFGASEIQGAGIAVTDFDANGQADLVVFRLEHPGGGAPNQGFYRVGFNMDINGDVALADWTVDKAVPAGLPNWFEPEAQGADITIANSHFDGPLDLVVLYLTHPGGGAPNRGYYRIGYHLSAPDPLVPGSGGDVDAAHGINGWSEVQTIALPGPGDGPQAALGLNTKGAGVAFVHVNADTTAEHQEDLAVLHLDSPAGPNRAYYRIGWKLDPAGELS